MLELFVKVTYCNLAEEPLEIILLIQLVAGGVINQATTGTERVSRNSKS